MDSDIFAPSALCFNNQSKVPIEMDNADIEQSIEAFKLAARRAKEADFDIVEIDGAHGYLVHQFLSPLTNKRTDSYGGSRENRYRFLFEVIEAIKTVWNGPIFVRLPTDEYHEDGNTLNDMIYFANETTRNRYESGGHSMLTHRCKNVMEDGNRS